MAFVYLITVILWIWAEIAAFVALGSAAGVLLTLIGIFVTGMIGISLLRAQGRRIAGALQAQLARGEAPVASLADGVSVLFGAVLMLIPGYLTDAAGLVMFLPGIRTIVGASRTSKVCGSCRCRAGGGREAGIGGVCALRPFPDVTEHLRQSRHAARHRVEHIGVGEVALGIERFCDRFTQVTGLQIDGAGQA